MKVAVVGAPEYFARHSPPRTPEDLARHSCVQYRLVAEGGVFKWPFERNGKSRPISLDGRVMVNDPDLAVRAAVDGLGIAYTLEPLAEPFLRSGQLVQVLGNWSPSFEGLFLYYPGHRQVPSTLRALIDMIRTARGSAPARRSLQNPFTKVRMVGTMAEFERNVISERTKAGMAAARRGRHLGRPAKLPPDQLDYAHRIIVR
jgi:LysR substrate binding domain/Resolvase, N terminal domain